MKYIKLLLILLLCCALAVGSLAGCGGKKADETPKLEDCPVEPEAKYGGVYIQISFEDFGKLGFEAGDSVDLVFSNGYTLEDLPYYSGYYVNAGEPLLLAYEGCRSLDACINYGDSLWTVAELEEGMTATITMNEKAKYLSIQNARDIQYVDDRDQFSSDVVFANFREVTAGEIAEGVLYRSASPCNNAHNRAPYVDDLIDNVDVNYILNLADNDEKVGGYIEDESFDSPYFLSLYEAGNVALVPMTMNFSSDDFKSQTADVLRAMAENEGPYLVHCLEGKDRTGFVCMLLEAFEGAGYQEIVDDYMITYDNYYQITETGDKDKYDATVESLLYPMLRELTGDADPKTADLAACAESYIRDIGLTDQDIAKLHACLEG